MVADIPFDTNILPRTHHLNHVSHLMSHGIDVVLRIISDCPGVGRKSRFVPISTGISAHMNSRVQYIGNARHQECPTAVGQ